MFDLLSERSPWLLIPLAMFIIAMLNTASPFLERLQFGDGKLILWVLSQPEKFLISKYLITSEILRLIYSAVWQFPPISAHFPPFLSGWEGYIRLFGAWVMFISAVYVIRNPFPRLPVLFTVLSPIMNFGNTNTLYEPYLMRSAGKNSIFFSLNYALRPEHLLSVCRLVLLSVGPVPIFFFFLGGFRLESPSIILSHHWTREHLVNTLLLSWSVVYLVLMLPKYGPDKDLDLFFIPYITFTFYSGRFLQNTCKRPNLAAASVLASSLACLAFIYFR